jgi:2-methylisocitrate lyase-like PEP mutase family enzyme
MSNDLMSRCETLRTMHVPGEPLVLPNAWDSASARAIVEAGYPAVATTSGGVARVLGFSDHEAAPVEEMFAAAARIARSVAVPVTVDAEAGYGLPATELVSRLFDLGAAGVNLEDTDHRGGSLVSLGQQADRLAAVRTAADAIGYPLVLNARVDLFAAEPEREQRDLIDECVARARAYAAAGADCVFPIFLFDPEARRALIRTVDVPVNLLSVPGKATVRELAADGAARVSFGPTLYFQTMATLPSLLASLGG